MIEYLEVRYCDFCNKVIKKDEMESMINAYKKGGEVVNQVVIEVRDECPKCFQHVCLDCNQKIASLVKSLKGENKHE